MARHQIGGDWQLGARMTVTMLLLAALYAAFITVLAYSGTGFVTMAIIVGGLLLVQYFFSDKLVLLSMGARKVSEQDEPELHAMVERLAALADIPKPAVAIAETDVPNGFATGRNPKSAAVCCTRGILRRLTNAELEGVLAHELTHIRNRDVAVITFASFFASVASFIMNQMFYWGLWGGYGRRRDDNGNALMIVYLVSFLTWVLSFFLIRALSRYREYAADRGSAILTGAPSHLASALLKISGVMERIPERDMRQVQSLNAFFIMPAVGRQGLGELFATHPSLEKRLAYLRRLEEELR
ncbi:MAG TPA: zinc metalloprotease HtpX [Limnochordia bacterium]|nr:zinc metalloprotease HtpX [Limnochordia bacterium]